MVIAKDILNTNITGSQLTMVMARGNLTGSLVAAGYDFGADGEVGGADDTLSGGSIGTAMVMGDMSASNIAAGVGPGADGEWGTTDDVAGGDGAGRLSLAMVTGDLTGDGIPNHSYGIVASEGVVSVRARNGTLRVDAPGAPQRFDNTNVYARIV